MAESHEHEPAQIENFRMKIKKFQTEIPTDKTLSDIDTNSLGAKEMQVWESYYKLLKQMAEATDLLDDETLNRLTQQLEALNDSILTENAPFYLWIRNRLTAPRSNFEILKQYKDPTDAKEIQEELQQEWSQFK